LFDIDFKNMTCKRQKYSFSEQVIRLGKKASNSSCCRNSLLEISLQAVRNLLKFMMCKAHGEQRCYA